MSMKHKQALQMVLIALVLGVAAPALATNGEHHAPTFWTYAFPFINFFLLLSVLFYFLKDNIKQMFSDRASAIQKGVAEAKAYHDDVLRRFRDVEQKLKNSEQEGKALLLSFKESANAERQNLLHTASEFIQQLKAETQNLIAQEVRKAQMTLRAETVELASDLARTHIQQNLTPDVQARLQTEFVQEVSHAKRGLA